MTDVIIENPILNSPYSEPMRHFKFDEERQSMKFLGAAQERILSDE